MISNVPEKPFDGQKAGSPLERKVVLITPPSTPVEACVFKRVTFQAATAPGASALIAFAEPERRAAVVEEKGSVNWPKVQALTSANVESAADFDCICIDSDASGADALVRAAEWNDGQGGAAAQSVRIKLDGGWVRAVRGRAVIYLPKGAWNAALSALADFFFYDAELRALERGIAAEWPSAERDLSLANDVTPADWKRLGEIGVTTRAVWLRRIRLAKMERPLAKSQVPLAPIGRKLAARLRAKFDVAGRVETLDGQIEVYEYIYEMANQRMGEYGNFRREYVLEIVIVVLLTAELAVMVLDFFRNSHTL